MSITIEPPFDSFSIAPQTSDIIRQDVKFAWICYNSWAQAESRFAGNKPREWEIDILGRRKYDPGLHRESSGYLHLATFLNANLIALHAFFTSE